MKIVLVKEFCYRIFFDSVDDLVGGVGGGVLKVF